MGIDKVGIDEVGINRTRKDGVKGGQVFVDVIVNEL